MNPHVVFSIFKRNFISYFSSPIGYVFICAFVLLSAFAAFWPNEFFNANLANLDQLNKSLPWIMLVIIPAITMSIWADERRQGTDELLLTLPAGDFQVVLGKYLASVAIFSVALLFSLCNIVVLWRLGRPDLGLLLANYVGYWLIGAGMLAVGMAASFLTSNLTVSFILAAAFNAPLAFAASADAIFPRDAALAVKSFSIEEQFRDFGRGVITLRGVVFFGSLAAVMLYVCMVLISRRHWAGRRAGVPMQLHYFIRILALVALAIGVNLLADRVNWRYDSSSSKLSSLSPQTRALLDKIDPKRPVIIQAYVSPVVPEEYVQTRLNLLTMLREVDAMGGDNVMLRVYNTERFSPNAAEAEQQFGIRGQPVQTKQRGSYTVNEVFLGVAFMSGLDKVVVPFFDRGIPVEYEVIRSIATVSQQQRKRIGLLATDARLLGGFDMRNMSRRPDEKIVDELKQQYDVVTVTADQPITERYDALLVVQPSSLTPPKLTNLINAIRAGQPTAIFEDPFPSQDGSVAATSQPRVPPGGMNPFQQQEPPDPKGDIGQLWSLLQIDMPAKDIVYQDYNPLPKVATIPSEFIFVDKGSRAEEPFSTKSAVTNGLQQLLMLFAGHLQPVTGSKMQFTPLVRTGPATGIVSYDDMIERNMFGQGNLNPNRRHRATGQSYVLAAQVRGTVDAAPMADAQNNPSITLTPQTNINVVVVADIDCLYSIFFSMRQRGTEPDSPIDINLDNVSFALNALDELAGDDRFIEIRKRRPAHRTLTLVQDRTEEARQTANTERENFIQQFTDKQAQEQRQLEQRIADLQKRPGIDPKQMMLEIQTAQEVGNNRLKTTVDQLQRERDKQLETIETDLALKVRKVQDACKLAAVTLPPIPPLVLAFVVLLRRRSLEKLGVPKQRLRQAPA